MSEALRQRIAGRIADRKGWISFEDFMREALYAPGLGYYESAEVFGAGGDFFTGVEVGPWLALGFADLLEWGWRQLASPSEWTLIEQGGGDGRLLCDVLRLLDERGMAMPVRIFAVERSVHMQQRQQAAYASLGSKVQIVCGLDELPACENALFFCNELPDAFPVRCLVKQEGGLHERGVGLDASGHFVWQTSETQVFPGIDERFVAAWPEGYISEWNPHLTDWQAGISSCMRRGFVFCVDYGYAQSEYYRPQRIEGTLLAHHKHEAVHDVLSDPGSRDITAHIDFTALARAGRDAGFSMTCWMAQGAWLAQSPSVQSRIREIAMQRTEQSAAQLAGAKRMLLPQGMGELFKLAVQIKGVESTAPDFLASFNRIDALSLGND
jgi:SAM-dependent MidA family methyltransferase